MHSRVVPFPLVALATITSIIVSCARATTFVPMDEHTLLRSSAAVIIGTIIGIESAEDADGALYTYVHVQPERVIKGRLGLDLLVLREPGGSLEDRHEWVYGAPEFRVGERALLFLSRNADGTLQTNSLAMGKYSLGSDGAGHTTATRDFGAGSSMLVPSTGEVVEAPRQTQRFLPLLKRLRRLTHTEPRNEIAAESLTLVPEELGRTPTQFSDAYTFLSTPPARWFEPDTHRPVIYLIDSTGDPTLGFTKSRAAVDAALAAWTNVPSADLILQDGGTTPPGPFSQCSINRIVFNDPNKELTPPTNCSGVLALGGYCTAGNTTVVNGTTFTQIVTGKLTFNRGWAGCRVWTQCNVAEVATHEIGHTIGLGHSTDPNATMYAMAHFDGRCAALEDDDINAVSFAYPQPDAPVTTSTPTRAATRATSTPVRTPTRKATPIPTNTRARTATAVPSPTPIPTRTPTSLPSYTATPTATPIAPSVSGQVFYYRNALPVSGATVDLQGESVPTALTDESGQFAFANLTAGDWQLQLSKSGDFNSAIDAADAVSMLESNAGIPLASGAQALACDVSGDGRVDLVDATLLLNYVVGLISEFPVAQLCGSDWAFTPVPALLPDASVQLPQISSGTCQPGAIAFHPLSAPASGQNFAAVLFGDCSGNWHPNPTGAGAGALRPINDRVRFGRVRAVPKSRNLRLPLYVNTDQPFRAIDLQLRYDPRSLRRLRVRATANSAALFAANLNVRGAIHLALASSTAIAPGTIAMLEFQPIGHGKDVAASVVSAAVDAP